MRSGTRRAAAALWGLGAGLASLTGILAVRQDDVGFAVVYGAVSAALVLLAVATARGNPLAETVSLVLLASQLIGVAGAAWEFSHFDDDNPKARHLQHLGINHRLALVANLVYSAVASSLFLWALAHRPRDRVASPPPEEPR